MTFKEGVAIVSGIVGALVAIGLVLQFFGIIVSGPGKRLEIHIVEETNYHAKVDTSVRELDGHAESNEQLLEAVILGECLENPYQNLVRQGLIKKCDSLGVRRR